MGIVHYYKRIHSETASWDLVFNEGVAKVTIECGIYNIEDMKFDNAALLSVANAFADLYEAQSGETFIPDSFKDKKDTALQPGIDPAQLPGATDDALVKATHIRAGYVWSDTYRDSYNKYGDSIMAIGTADEVTSAFYRAMNDARDASNE